MCKSRSGSEGQYFKEVCTRQFLKTCILLLPTDLCFFDMGEIYYPLKCSAGLQINCMLWFQEMVIRSPKQHY